MTAEDERAESLTEDTWISISPDPIDFSALVSFVTDPSAGGISMFLGTTRDHHNHDGVTKRVLRLEYEAYVPMALSSLLTISTQIKATFPLSKIALHHRIGVVGISEVSLAVLVSGTHRAEPIEAVKAAVNAVKASVPIWKKEIYDDGSVWKGNVECRWNCGSCPSGSLSTALPS